MPVDRLLETGFDPMPKPPDLQTLKLSALLAEADFCHMLSLLPVGICYVDPGRAEIVLANESAASILALPSAQDLVGQSVYRFVLSDRRPQVDAYLRAVAEEAPPSRFFFFRSRWCQLLTNPSIWKLPSLCCIWGDIR
jgi:PAS domain-containing protein